MRFHVVSLPHTQTNKDFPSCAFTAKVQKFCNMMHRRGHEIILYAGEFNEAECSEFVPCMLDSERQRLLGDTFYVNVPFKPDHPLWFAFNNAVIRALKTRRRPGDFICIMGGLAQKPIGDVFGGDRVVEFGIGYPGTFANYRVFESYAWMHTVNAADKRSADIDGSWYDAVIPNYYDPALFQASTQHIANRGYYLFVGRITHRKGYNIAMDVCKKLDTRLIVAGPGGCPAGLPEHNYYGPVSEEHRNELMRGAIATFVPSQYVEPFGGVVTESYACGTPVITTDWGAFPEIVKQGVTGFRCHNFKEFVDAAVDVKKLFPSHCRKHFEDNYSFDVIAPQYERYFERLNSLYKSDAGWYEVD